jgi:hypothetical protein
LRLVLVHIGELRVKELVQVSCLNLKKRLMSREKLIIGCLTDQSSSNLENRFVLGGKSLVKQVHCNFDSCSTSALSNATLESKNESDFLSSSSSSQR